MLKYLPPTEPIEKPVKPHSLALAGDRAVCVGARAERTNNSRGLYMTSLPLKGHPAGGVSVERLSVVDLVATTRLLHEIHFAL